MNNEKIFLSRVNEYLAREVFPGCEFSLIDGGETQHYLRGEETLRPVLKPLEAGKLWDLASVSKVLGTGSLIIEEVLAGHLELERSLQSYLPSWHDSTVTLRQLLTHTSGINPYIKKRDELNFAELKAALLKLPLREDRSFHYTDVNFILLGFMLEEIFQQDLQSLLVKRVFLPRHMTQTTISPAPNAVVTTAGLPAGQVHDPKARVLGAHCGSAGLFSSLSDLEKFVRSYFSDEKYLKLYENYSPDPLKRRSLAWGVQTEDWLIHTGYTGTFVLMNLKRQQAVIFLSNRVHLKDERAQWIKERDLLIQDFIASFES